ncbi:MAG: universal stress protein [Acidobacteria bacterium]|nr:universal stress protein [Acidobacteriota bacterium]
MIALKRILVPHDFSETSAAAVNYAVTLARSFGAELVFLYVGDRAQARVEGGMPDGPDGEVTGAAHEAMVQVLAPADRTALNPRCFVLAGSPAEEIVRVAREHEFDLIVMGTHGRGLVGHLLMGSVAEKVVRTAPCPVLTVRNPYGAQGLEVVAEAAEAARVAV